MTMKFVYYKWVKCNDCEKTDCLVSQGAEEVVVCVRCQKVSS